MREGWICKTCGCGPFLSEEQQPCLHCKDSDTHMATHRQHEYDHSHAFIQWKGTNVCMDFYCLKCGYQDHLDHDFVYYIKCLNCGTTYMTGWYVDMVELTPDEALSVENSPALFRVNDPDDDDDC